MDRNEIPLTLGDYLDVLQRRRIYLLTVAPAALLIAIYVAYALPPQYRASATVLMEPSSIPAQLVKMATMEYADQQFELAQRRLMVPEQLERVVSEIDPYPDQPELSDRAKARKIAASTSIERVDPITLETLKTSNAFSIHYLNPDPELAAAIAQRIADLFLEYNRLTRGERASEAFEFISAQAKDVEQRIEETEARIAQFKTRYGDALPETQARNIAATERIDRELLAIETQIRNAEDRQALLNVQLGQISPTLTGTAGSNRAELAILRAQLADARARYTPDHPDVKRLRRQIESLAARVEAEGDSPAIVPDNPEYLAVQSQLTAVQREIAALRATAARARAQISGYESRLSVAPAVEQEYSELTRVRDVLLAQYKEIQAKLREADVARSLEIVQMGGRFSQIRSPSVPASPFEPNRVGIILLGIVLGFGLAIGLAALAESSDPTVRGLRDLRELSSISTIAAVPVLVNEPDRRRQLVWWVSYVGVLLTVSILIGFTVVIN